MNLINVIQCVSVSVIQFDDTLGRTVGLLDAKHKSCPFTKTSKGSEITAQRDEKYGYYCSH